MLDYLAEITMSILARMRAKNPDLGYATDFVSLVMKPLAREIAEKRIKVVANAGGVNPAACRAALEAVFARARRRSEGRRRRRRRSHGARGRSFAQQRRKGNVQRRAVSRARRRASTPISARCRSPPRSIAGADIVLTGRCVDSALALGPLIHEFGWSADDYDRLSAGSLAGHVHRMRRAGDRRHFHRLARSRRRLGDMGFPIAECDGGRRVRAHEARRERADSSSTATVAEQIVYEVGDPAAYLLPDVSCDWSERAARAMWATIACASRARAARAPTSSYKVSRDLSRRLSRLDDDDDRGARGGRKGRGGRPRRARRARAG